MFLGLTLVLFCTSIRLTDALEHQLPLGAVNDNVYAKKVAIIGMLQALPLHSSHIATFYLSVLHSNMLFCEHDSCFPHLLLCPGSSHSQSTDHDQELVLVARLQHIIYESLLKKHSPRLI